MTVGQLILYPIATIPSDFRSVMNDPRVIPSRSAASLMGIKSTDRGKSLAEDFGGDWLCAFNVDFVVCISSNC
jgi:hypothetical protein